MSSKANKVNQWNVVASAVLTAILLGGCANAEEDRASIEQLVTEMNRRIERITTSESKDGFVPRFNQPKTVACVQGDFEVHENIPDDLKHGIFASPRFYPAFLRFANAANADDSEKDIRG